MNLGARYSARWSTDLLIPALLIFASLPMRAGENGDGVRAPATPPNIVLIFADDLGYGNLGVYGQQLIETPNLDQMAADGLRFTDFYSGDAWCPASRNSLLSGLHTGHTQLRGVGVLEEDSEMDPRYLPRLLQSAGYTVGMFGKWGLGSYWPAAAEGAEAQDGRPSELGFDEFLGQMNHRDAHNFSLPPYPQEPGDPWLHPKLWTISAGETVELPDLDVPYTPDPLLASALDFIERHQDQPFFLYLPTALPHAELYLPEDDEAWTPYLDEDDQSIFPETPWPGNFAFRRPVAFPRAAFAAMVTRLDRDVGLILEQLEDLGLAENTLVFFSSDNGPASDGGFEDPWFFGSSGGLRDFKLSLYEGGIRVPMIANWPGTIAAGSETDLPMAIWDLFPTLLEIAGVDPPPGLDGISMRPRLLGNLGDQPLHDENYPLYWETFNWIYSSQAVRLGDWKAVRPDIVHGGDAVELYDLGLDSHETLDLSEKSENCALLLQLKQMMNDAHVPPPEDPYDFLAVPALNLDCPILFSDGFESADAGAWPAGQL